MAIVVVVCSDLGELDVNVVVVIMYVEESARICMWERCGDLILRGCGGILWSWVEEVCKMYRF